MKVLLAGGTGFIGMNLCKRLLDAGHTVRILGRKDENIGEDVEFIQGDFNNNICYDELLNNIDIVYHLISTTVPGTSNNDKIFDLSSNVVGTLNFLEHIVRSEVKKIIFISSGGTIYGNNGKNKCSELTQTNPISSYGIQKLTIEKYLYLYFIQYGLDYNIIRLSNPYGIGQDGKNNQGIIPIFIKKIKNNEKITIWGDGNIVRDYIYIDDVTKALVKMLDYNGNEKIFNLGSGKGVSVLQIANLISEIIGIKFTIDFLPGRNIDVFYNVLDIDRISRELCWNPEVDLKTGISLLAKVL